MNTRVATDPVMAGEVILEEPLGARLAEKLSEDLGHGEEVPCHLGVLQSAPELWVV